MRARTQITPTTKKTLSGSEDSAPRRNPTANKAVHKELDQFYTQPSVARACWRTFVRIAGRLDIDVNTYWFVEPAAGCGCFYQLLPQRKRIGIDIAPGKLPRVDSTGIAQADYLSWQPPAKRSRKYAVIGNPPFGKRGKLAIAFFNRSVFADLIAFVVPVTFRKYAVHRQLHPEYALIARKPLSRDSFCTPANKAFAVNAEFQIWTKLPVSMKNLRAHTPPPTTHSDFNMRQYNNTKQALKMFDQPFDFAVPCQGFQDYTRRETNAIHCEKHKQWMMLTARTTEIKKRLMKMDFAMLAMECATAIPGFRKNDVVRYYDSLSI